MGQKNYFRRSLFFVTPPRPVLLTLMLIEDLSHILLEQRALPSVHLQRYVIVDFYLPKNITNPSDLSLLLLNDGQNLDEMPFAPMLNGLLSSGQIQPLLCAGMHCNKDRREEYATAARLDFDGRGKKSKAHQKFVVEELIPFIYQEYGIESFAQKAIAGFSLGGLSAIDTLWNHPDVFSIVGVFSGSLWWRKKSLGDGYNDATDRIMHNLIRKGTYQPGLRFYFMTGSLDETADRNNNGIIDSIDDTLDVIKELEKKGYDKEKDIYYINYEDGRHDVPTWGKAMPAFLLWGWSRRTELQTGDSFLSDPDDKKSDEVEAVTKGSN